MARRRKDEGQGVSLFPFLSILACVIGVLTLLITGLAVGQLDRPEGRKAERAEQYQKLLEEIEKAKEDVEVLEQFLAQADTISRARRELDRLRSEKSKAIRNKQESIRLLAELNRLKERIQQELEPDWKEIEKELKELEAELKRRKAPPEEPRVVVRPSGSGVNLVPTFVECTKTGIFIHEGPEPKFIRRGDMARDLDFIALLDRVAGTERGTVIFLIRDDAVGTYNVARSVANSRYCRNGKLPLIGHGELDLTIFRRAGAPTARPGPASKSRARRPRKRP
ncbi:MAG TPA: hypothetical protein EYP14_08015 [Planctomycetaceae bacterium]|nr:hypothetical protein [Planctomycetaceae bacterium]